MATAINMLEACKDYARGGWSWGQRDCIGLMFELVRKTTGKQVRQTDYMPAGLSYHAAIDWLINENEYVLFPYFKLLDLDLKLPRAKADEDGHLILMSKGKPLTTSSGEMYPIDPIPGIAFKPPKKLPLVFGAKGLVSTTIPENDIDWLIKYKLPGIE